MAVQHTSGPWGIDNSIEGYGVAWGDIYQRIYSEDPGGDRDFTIGFVRDADPEVKAANGRLLAAAPELLQALEAVIQDFGSHCLSVQTINRMMAAVDRARGVSQ